MTKSARLRRARLVVCLGLGWLAAAGCRDGRFFSPSGDFDAFVLRAMDRAGVPGLSLTILANGRVEPARTYGTGNRTIRDPVSEGTVFEACSLSKPVLAYAALILVAEGRLDLDRPLLAQASEEVLKREFFRGKIEDDRVRGITPRMVLSHRSGFPNWRGGRLTLIADPGTRFGYSGEGFVLLQRVVEQIAGRPLNEFVRERVFVPLGMTSSSYVWIPEYETSTAVPHTLFGTAAVKRKPSSANGAASLHTTSGDYARFLAAVLQGRGLTEGLRREMLTEQTVVAPGVGWGLGLGLETAGGREYLWHWGDNGNFKCFFLIDRKTRSGFVYFANGYFGLSPAQEFARRFFGNSHPVFATDIMKEYDPLDSPIFDIVRAASENDIEAGLDIARKAAASDTGKVSEESLNAFGYALLGLNRLDEAIKVFELNVDLYPQSWNVYDSLAEALERQGNAEAAVQNYERSLKLNPENAHAVVRLKILRKK
ncbi:MAG: class A beta-lactamase-related serine hydrolase [Candidatus Aminicenantes bacterium]|nr:class A beta-lactamase-related serine hydrolase [Candidatus Aminicenantes bacterium]